MPTESGGMEAFNMKKKWIICISIITIAYFVLSLFDFMYIPADKYPNIIREIFFHDNEKVTVRFAKQKKVYIFCIKVDLCI